MLTASILQPAPMLRSCLSVSHRRTPAQVCRKLFFTDVFFCHFFSELVTKPMQDQETTLRKDSGQTAPDDLAQLSRYTV